MNNFHEMSGRFTFIVLLLLSSAHVIFSCVDEPKTTASSIEGRWEIVRGLRNGQQTGTLSGTYFRFGADGKMITNLPVGPEVSAEYEMTKSSILQKGPSPIKYSIFSGSDTSLVLGFELRGMQFEIVLRKVQETDQLRTEQGAILPDSTDFAPADSLVK